MKLKLFLMKVRDFFAMKAHYGWAHYLSKKIGSFPGPHRGLMARIQAYLCAFTQNQSALFDARYGTDTFDRGFYPVSDDPAMSQQRWGYAPVNREFLHEMLRAVPVSLKSYTFIDLGAGKGAAIMHASKFGFRRYLAVELQEELIKIGQKNIQKYKASSGEELEPEWIQTDFMKWPMPDEDFLIFLNNPLPGELSLEAVRKIENSAHELSRRVLLVYRKPPPLVNDHLKASRFWNPIKLAPYWRIYASPALAQEL